MGFLRNSFVAVVAMALAGALHTPVAAQEVRRVMPPNTPIATSAIVPPGTTLIFLSGILPAPVDPTKPNELGDTKAQTMNILSRMKAQLEELGSSMGNVVKMTVFLVGVPEKGGQMDRPAMNEAFRTFFGTPEQPNKPTRSTIQVAGLGNPAVLVEIEAIAVAGK